MKVAVPDVSSRRVNITVVCVVDGNFVVTSQTYCHDHSGHICIPDSSYNRFGYVQCSPDGPTSN